MKQAITPSRLNELKDMAIGLYGTMTGLATDPFEMVTIISIVHIMLWLNTRAEGYSTEQMLEDYCENFILNFNANEPGETLQ